MNNIFLRKELLKLADTSESTLSELEKYGLIKSSGKTEEEIPFYTQGALEQIAKIESLRKLGYNLQEISKIIKKIGLPNKSNTSKDEKEISQYITVSNLAKQVGVSTRTIKHWEEKKIIESELRSSGGFRLYPQIYVYMCKLIRDLQLFNYSLDEIKVISEYFKEFLKLNDSLEHYSNEDTEDKLNLMYNAITQLFAKMNLLKEGISRWESLLKTKQKEIQKLKTKNNKRTNKNKKD